MEIYKEFIKEEKACEFINNFCDLQKTNKFVMGRNIYADAISRQFDIDGIIDDFCTETTHNGKKIFRSNEISYDALVLICAGERPFVAMEKLNNMGFCNTLDFFSFLKYSHIAYQDDAISTNFSRTFSKVKKCFDVVHSYLSDDISKIIFTKLLNFKLTFDCGYLVDFFSDVENQYFFTPPLSFLDLSSTYKKLVDVGGFDGSTTLRFIKRYPEYKKIYFFEPEKKNFDVAKRNLKDIQNIEFINKGVSDRVGDAFIVGRGWASAVSDKGDQRISLTKIDDIVSPSSGLFIKMDIEGGEYDAILGARRVIETSSPVMAICVYHKLDDFWKIPFLVLSINPNYKIYLRHYTESHTETVMYFFPS